MCHRKAEQRASTSSLRKETTQGPTVKAVTEGKTAVINNTGPILLKSRGFCRHFEHSQRFLKYGLRIKTLKYEGRIIADPAANMRREKTEFLLCATCCLPLVWVAGVRQEQLFKKNKQKP